MAIPVVPMTQLLSALERGGGKATTNGPPTTAETKSVGPVATRNLTPVTTDRWTGVVSEQGITNPNQRRVMCQHRHLNI